MPEAVIHGSPFNSALETGLRSLAILAEACPDAFDLQRLLYFDYLVVHSSDADGPASLHPSTPLRNGELLVRRGLIERGLLLFIGRGLVERNSSSSGISYVAAEAAAPFLERLGSIYSRTLRERASWAIETFGVLDETNSRATSMRALNGGRASSKPPSRRRSPSFEWV